MDFFRNSYPDDQNSVPVKLQSPPHSFIPVDGAASATLDETTASDSSDRSYEIGKPQNSTESPNFTKPWDTDEEEDEEDYEPLSKKQRQISSFPLLPRSDLNCGLATPSPLTPAQLAPSTPAPGTPSVAKAASKSSKKSKKKNNNPWVTASRKSRKKSKNNVSNNNSTPTNNALEAAEDRVMITPTQFPDKNDDTPEAKICLSKVYKAEKVELSEDRMSAGSTKGYRMVRATRGVIEGAWYFEIKVVHLGSSGHTRLGWSTDKGDLQAPVGYDGNSFGYRDIDGSKVHKAVRDKYGEEGYKEGDVIGFYINLPAGSLFTPKAPRCVLYQGRKWVSAPDAKDDPPRVVSGSEICFYKNGQCQGTAFSDLFGGRYFPAASLYTLPNQPNCTVKFNFGPDFEFFPDDFGGRVVPSPMIEVPFHDLDVRVENGSSSWHPTRMCPMLINVVKEQVTEIVDADA